MKGSSPVLELCYPADDNALELARHLFDKEMRLWRPSPPEGKGVIIAGGSNRCHHKLHEILIETRRETPHTLLFLDQHMDRHFLKALPALFIQMSYKISLDFNYANFMHEVEELNNIDQVIYLGISSHMPSTHKLAIDRYHLNEKIKDLFIYPSTKMAEMPEPDVKPGMLENPAVALLLYAYEEGKELSKKDHGMSTLYQPSYYPERKKLIETLENHHAIRSFEKTLDQIDVTWKNIYEFNPSVIRNRDVWISLDFDMFDESTGIPTAEPFGTVPYEWFSGFIDKLDDYNINGFDYWGFDKEKNGYEPLPKIREIHENVKEQMLNAA